MAQQPLPLSAAASAQLEALRNMEDNQPIPQGRPKPKIVVDRPPKPKDLMAMGLKIRDMVHDQTVERARPVWTQQIQPTGPSSQGLTIRVRARPKTPETYINTPTVTPNGSYLWATKEEEQAAMSQQQAAQSQALLQPQATQPVPLTKDLTQEVTNTPIASSSKVQAASFSKLPNTPLGVQVSVIFNAPNKLKRKLRHNGSSDNLPEAKPSKVRRQIPMVDDLPVPRYSLRSRTHPAAEATPTPNPGRTLRSRAKGKMPAASAEISCGISRKGGANTRPLRNPPPAAKKGSRPRRS
ncbi:hypothetical protein H1R20_g15011, partial [Candolleomyces eurysporus]